MAMAAVKQTPQFAIAFPAENSQVLPSAQADQNGTFDTETSAPFLSQACSRLQKRLSFWNQLTRPTAWCLLAVLLLNVAGNVHEEGDGQQQRLHNVRGVEVSTSINLCPLGVVIVEPWMTQNSWHCSKLGPNCPIYCIYIKDIYIYIIYISQKKQPRN